LPAGDDTFAIRINSGELWGTREPRISHAEGGTLTRLMIPTDERLSPRRGEVIAAGLLETHLARTLLSLEREHAHGLLDIEAEGGLTTYYLRDGKIVFAEAGIVGETLGRLLVRQGILSPEQYATILRRMTDALVHDELMRFGEVAMELGYLSSEQVSAGLSAQVRERLVRGLQFESAQWTFRDDPEASSQVAHFRCPLGTSLYEALSEPQEASKWIRRLELRARSAVALITTPAEAVAQLGLGPGELRNLRALDGSRRISELLGAETSGAESRAAILASLLLLDLAELRTVTAVTAVSPSLPKAPRSDEPPIRAPTETATRAAMVADQLKHDLERRHGAPPAARRDESRSRLTAEQHFEVGRRLLREGKLGPAQKELGAASAAMPDAAEYRLAHSFVEWLMPTETRARTGRETGLRALVLATLKADKRCAFAHYVQGRLDEAAGEHEKAARAFALASKLDPHDIEAARWMRLSRARLGQR
jgi:hypothetical protein